MQGFFEVLCYNTIFVFRIEFVKDRRREKSAGRLRGVASLPVGPGQSYGGVPGGEAPGRSAYLSFENLLLKLKISHLLLIIP